MPIPTGKNININPRKITIDNSKDIITKISTDLNDFDPPIDYTVELLMKNVKDYYIEVQIHNKEFMLSPAFEQYLVTIQSNYLWTKQIYDVNFIYKEKN